MVSRGLNQPFIQLGYGEKSQHVATGNGGDKKIFRADQIRVSCEFRCRSGMDHHPVFKADDMVTVEGFDVEMLGIAFPMDAGFVLPHLQDFPFGTSTLN